MKQVNFSNSGGFPLEQETLERLQTAYRSELYEALKSHLSITKDKNYIIAPATNEKIGWVIIHQNGEGILYPIECLNQLNNKVTNFLKATRTGTSLVYGSGASKTAYFDYTAVYIEQIEFNNRTSAPSNNDTKTEYYYDLTTFKKLTNLQTIDDCLETITKNIELAQGDINKIKTDLESYLPLDGSKAMKGDLDLGTHLISKLDVKESFASCVRVVEFNLGSKDRKGKLNPQKPTGRALVDSSTDSNTMLTVNYESDWEYTCVGGNVYLNNINTSNKDFKTSESSDISLLLLDNANQVVKSNNLLDSLLSRISKLEKQSTGIPIGMIALWGKPAPFPEGWEEYVPLRGRMPVGFAPYDSDFGNWNKTDGGSRTQTLQISQMPRHSHPGSTAAGPYNGDDIDGGGGFDGSHSNIFKKRPVEIMPEGSGDPFKILNPYRVVHFIEYTGGTRDITAPTNPTNLSATNIGPTYVDLQWAKSNDDRGVTNYLVYQDESLVAILDNITSCHINGLSRSSSYNFYIIAQDAAGNLSGSSNTIRVKTNLL